MTTTKIERPRGLELGGWDYRLLPMMAVIVEAIESIQCGLGPLRGISSWVYVEYHGFGFMTSAPE